MPTTPKVKVNLSVEVTEADHKLLKALYLTKTSPYV